MISEADVLLKNGDSFLLDHILDLVNQKESLIRAAQISPFVSSITLGPNSSYRIPVAEEETETHEKSEQKTPKQKENRPQTSPSTTTSVTTKDLECLRMKLQGLSEERSLREKVQKLLEERAAKERAHEEKMQLKVEAMKLEVEKKYLERIEKLEKQLAMAMKLEEQEELSYQNHRSELTKNARKVIEQQEKELLESTKRLEEEFNKNEANFINIVQACNQANSMAIDSYKKQFEAVKIKKIASRSLGNLKNVCIEADEICNALSIANKAFEENMRALKEAEAQNAATEVEKAKIAAQAVVATQPQLLPPSAPAPDQQQKTPSETKRQYTELMQFLREKQNATRLFREAEQFQELRFRLKVAVNGPINHLNEQNKNSLIEGFQKLQSLLLGQKVSGSKGEVSVTEHPEATDWTKLRIAEKLIDVGDKKKEAVFFIAAIVAALWQQFPDFGSMFLALLFKECPFLVPHKPGQKTNQSDIDFLRSWGYRVTDKAEEYKIYQDRTSNYAQLLAAVWVTSSRRNVSAPHPYGIDNGWKYLVNVMRSDPDPMYLHFIDKVFEIAGSTLQSTYGHQFKKLVLLVHNNYLRALEGRVDEGMKAAWDRLDVMVVKFFNEGKFEKPAKMLHANFW